MKLEAPVIASLALCAAVSARAEDFTFQFLGAAITQGGAAVTITGEIYGLAPSGLSSPTSVFVDSQGRDFVFSPTDPDGGAMGTFGVSDGHIISADYSTYSFQFGCDAGCGLSLNDLGDFVQFGSGNIVVAGPGFSTVTYTAVPEPAAWVLMLAGVGALGAGLRRARVDPAPAP